jgi:hypothetical protein
LHWVIVGRDHWLKRWDFMLNALEDGSVCDWDDIEQGKEAEERVEYWTLERWDRFRIHQ